MMRMPAADSEWVLTAQRIADDELFPAAPAVERLDRVPPNHLNLLADHGFYGLPAPVEFGGLGRAGFPVLTDVIAALAGGCLTTTFVWLQHLAPLMAVATVAQPDFRDRWLGPMAAGQVRAGLAMARPHLIRVTKVPGGYTLTGESAWVTGWELIDILLVGGVDERGLLHFFLIDARSSPTLVAEPSELMAVQASRTVSLRFTGHFVPDDRLGHTEPFASFVAAEAQGSVMNGFLALGVAGRCARLLEAEDLVSDIAQARLRLLTAAGEQVPTARAEASLLASRAAARLMVQTGSRSVLADEHAGRLYRESGFLLVFGLRPAIKTAMLQRLADPVGEPA
ncbi:acyl-CoA dehydrogenase domain protein [Nakamurella multipartita DSM 44233]|uniref:Acyl-CoA dehydrogenase domain protein n=2 Tax=Nakamurella TaxID=53460 RepID=C8XCD3_NAKMY|nr:acyl-CoA dehydrogenase domain protein [Nakamurella multipartita DSM 44233]